MKDSLTQPMAKALLRIKREGHAHAWGSFHISTLKALYSRGLITVFKGPGGTGPFIRPCKDGEKPQNGHLLCNYDPKWLQGHP